MSRPRAALACALAFALLAGCSSIRPYPNDVTPKNLTIRTKTSSGSAFSTVRASLGVHAIDAQCRTRYLGTVQLDKPSIEVGVPADRPAYLVFDFSTSGFLSARQSRITREIMLKPKAAHRYEIEVTYRDDIYGVVVRERSPRGTLREPTLSDLRSCGARASRL